MPGGPIPPGFFQVRTGPRVLCSGHSMPGPGQAGGRGGVRSSSVCHGLNTVVFCWFRLFPPIVLPTRTPTPPPQPRRGDKKNGAQSPPACAASLLLEFVFSSHQLRAHDTARPGSGRRWGCFPVRLELCFNKRLFFFFFFFFIFFSASELFFVSVLLLLSLSLFTLPVQTAPLRRHLKNKKPSVLAGLGIPSLWLTAGVFPSVVTDGSPRASLPCAARQGGSSPHVGREPSPKDTFLGPPGAGSSFVICWGGGGGCHTPCAASSSSSVCTGPLWGLL